MLYTIGMDRKSVFYYGEAVLTKFKKIVSGTLAGCLMASALMMSAGAANVQTTVISKAGVQAAARRLRHRFAPP